MNRKICEKCTCKSNACHVFIKRRRDKPYVHVFNKPIPLKTYVQEKYDADDFIIVCNPPQDGSANAIWKWREGGCQEWLRNFKWRYDTLLPDDMESCPFYVEHMMASLQKERNGH